MKGAAILLTNAGAGNGADVYFNGGKCALVANATFGGGSIKLQMKIDIGNTAVYFDVVSAAFTAAGYLIYDLPPGTYRAVVVTSTACYFRIVSIPQS